MDLTIEQTHESFKANVTGIVRGTVSLALSAAGGLKFIGECSATLQAYPISPDELDRLAAQPSKDAFLKYVFSTIFSPGQLNEMVQKCAPKSITSIFLGALSDTVSQLYVVRTVDDAASLFAKIWYTFEYRNTSKSVAVCLSTNLFGSPSIQDCAERFTFDDPAPILVPNARFTPRVIALTAGGQSTGVPIGVTHSSSDAAQAVVTVLTPENGAPQTGELVANGVGSATITVRDPFTGAYGIYNVTVVRPVITPSVVKVGVGQGITLSLTDSNGNPVVTDRSGITWSSSDETVAAIVPEASILFYPNGAVIKGLKPGKVTIKVTNPVSFDVATAEMEVVLPDLLGTWSGPFSFFNVSNGCTFDYSGLIQMTVASVTNNSVTGMPEGFSGSIQQSIIWLRGNNGCEVYYNGPAQGPFSAVIESASDGNQAFSMTQTLMTTIGWAGQHYWRGTISGTTMEASIIFGSLASPEARASMILTKDPPPAPVP